MLQLIVMYRSSLSILLYLLVILPIRGQEKEPNAISIPNQKLNNLLQGRTYYPNYLNVVGSQFITNDWQVGKITLMDEVYSDLPLWYDIYTDDLILIDWQGLGYGMIKLNKEHIESFEFDNRRFINPTYNDYRKYGLGHIFHEVMTEGTVSFLVRRTINMQQENSVNHFVRKDAKILIYSDQMFLFKNKKSFLKAIPPSTKDDIVKYIRKNKIHFKKADDSLWTRLIVLVNELLYIESGKE
jgi:hypothetical protein